MKIIPVLLFLTASCRCSEPRGAATPAGEVGVAPTPSAEPITDLSVATFSDDDFARLGLEGGWVAGSGADEVDVRFRVLHGKLVVDGPLGDYTGGLVDGVIVLSKRTGGDGPPVVQWLNLTPAPGGELKGWLIEQSGKQGPPVEFVLRRR